MSTYTDENNEGCKIRTFEETVQDQELIWHKDENERIVEVLESKGWQFQFDNELPIGLQRGTIITIPKEKIHRVIKGSGKLVIKIKEI